MSTNDEKTNQIPRGGLQPCDELSWNAIDALIYFFSINLSNLLYISFSNNFEKHVRTDIGR